MKLKRILPFVLALMISGCSAQSKQELTYEKYSMSFFGTFDTVISIIGYAPDQATFDQEAAKAQELFTNLHQQFDKYHLYEGVNNLRTLNEQAAQQPVPVPQELFDLILYCKEHQTKLRNTVNIALGSVLALWHDAREKAEVTPTAACLPDKQALLQAALHTDIDDIVLDQQNRTVMFTDPALQLDLGAAAKGYATELVAQQLLKGPMPSFIINAGGNVRTGHSPKDGRNNWGVAIQHPDGRVVAQSQGDIIETLFVHDLSVVTSGDYQRYVEIDGVRYHHIISPETLMPTHHMRSVSILTEHSGYADLLSTAVFLMPFEEGLAFVESLPGVEAVWVLNDCSVRMTKGAEAVARSFGASNYNP